MLYVVPTRNVNVTWASNGPGYPSLPCVISPASVEPVYTATNESKLEPAVSKVTTPLVAGVQRYHTVMCGVYHPSAPGSSGSAVAPVLTPVILPEVPEIACAPAKASLSGAVVPHASATVPCAPATPSTAIE